MDIKIKTDLDTLSEAWNILDELGLSAALIPGNPVETNGLKLAGELLGQKKLHAFVACISGIGIDEAGKLNLSEASGLITDFFVSMASDLASLAGIWSSLKGSRQESPQIPSGE